MATAPSSIHFLGDTRSARRPQAAAAAAGGEEAMRRETFETPGPLTLDIRVPSGDIDLETDSRAARRVVELVRQPGARGGGPHRAPARGATGTS